jgi:hypothetical protein
MSRHTGDAADSLTPATGSPTLLTSTPTAQIDAGTMGVPPPRHASATAGVPSRLESAHRGLLTETDSRVHPFLRAAHRSGVAAFDGGGRTDAADHVAVGVYVAAVVVSVAAEGHLDEAGAQAAVEALADARDEPLEAARFDLHRTACTSPLLIELPPLVACEVQLQLLVQLGVAEEVSLWRADDGSVEPVLALGEGAASRRARATAKGALRRGSSLSLLGGRTLRSALVRRFSSPCAAIVARVSGPVA